MDNGAYKVVDTIFARQSPGDTVSVTILDKNGTNITGDISIGLLVRGVGIYPLEFDMSGKRKIGYKRINGYVFLKTLHRVFQQDFEFSTDTANNFLIKLNVPREWVVMPNSVWTDLGKFQLLKQNDQLTPFTPEFSHHPIYILHKE